MLRQFQQELVIASGDRGLYEFTGQVQELLSRRGFTQGLAVLHLQHTSASLLIQENADPDVRRDLDAFPEAARGWKVLATYNGLAFDLPVLRRAFPRWRPPVAHVDLRHLWSRLGHRGGLKALEEACGRPRLPHLRGLDGRDAIRLWRRHLDGDAAALRLFAEYNLHDAVSLRTLLLGQRG